MAGRFGGGVGLGFGFGKTAPEFGEGRVGVEFGNPAIVIGGVGFVFVNRALFSRRTSASGSSFLSSIRANLMIAKTMNKIAKAATRMISLISKGIPSFIFVHR